MAVKKSSKPFAVKLSIIFAEIRGIMFSSQSVAVTATPGQFLPVGLDTGNGFIKFVSGQSETLTPSLVKQLFDSNEYEYTASSRGGLIEYLQGDRQDLADTRWLVGLPAYKEFPDSCIRIADDRRHKINFALQGLCASIAQAFPFSKTLDLALCLSIHDAQAFQDEVKAALNGTHVVRINGNIVTLNLKTLVVDEGTGAIFQAIRRGNASRDGQSILVDIGYGTTIIAVYNGLNLLRASRYVHPLGTGKLIQLIADHLETRKFCGGVSGDVTLLRQGIEAGDFRYGATSWNFRDVYQACLQPWVTDTLSPTLKKIEPWLASSQWRLATGGGALMPGMSHLLAKKGFAVVEGSQMANVLGMQAIATSKLGGK